jgi:hypothetical protein
LDMQAVAETPRTQPLPAKKHGFGVKAKIDSWNRLAVNL